MHRDIHDVAACGRRLSTAVPPPRPLQHTWLKLLAVPCCSMLLHSPGSTAASVVMMASMVAMLGWIMPLPLAKPPTRMGVPPTLICRQRG